MKHRKHRWLAGTLAFLLSCSALIPSENAVFAASKGRVAESETNVIKEEKGDENEKQITAETLTIEQGESFEIEKDFRGSHLHIVVKNPGHAESGCEKLFVNGEQMKDNYIPQEKLTKTTEVELFLS